MCGRAVLASPVDLIERFFDADAGGLVWTPRYNLSPTEAAPIVRLTAAEKREIDLARWGLVGRRSHGPGDGPLAINARSETAASSRLFGEAMRERRCIVPVDGFYEWSRGKQPYFFSAPEGGLLALAGIWEAWLAPDGEPLLSFSILTRDAGETVARVHHRQPVVLTPADLELWLDRKVRPEQLRALLERAPPDLARRPVSRRVNRAGEEGADLLDEVEPRSEPEQRRLFDD